MSRTIVGRTSGCAVVAAGALFLAVAAAQAPAAKPVAIVLRYTPGSTLYFADQIDTVLGGQPMTEANMEVAAHILSSAGPDDYLAEAHFTKYDVTVTATEPASRAQAQAEAAQEENEALALPPVRFHLLHNQVSIVSRAQGAAYDEAVNDLEGMLRNDDVPSTPEPVGGHWQSQQNYPIGIGSVSIPVALDCTLTKVGVYQGEPTATIVVHSQAGDELPAAEMPGMAALIAQGMKVANQLTMQGVYTVQHRLSDGVAVVTRSEEHVHIQISATGPDGQAHTQATDIVTNDTETLERIEPPPAAGGEPASAERN